MRPIINSTDLIAACGLYCGACKRYLNDKCPGCRHAGQQAMGHHRRQHRWLMRCGIRRCCHANAYKTCAECDREVRRCKTYNTLLSRLFAVIFNSDRAACIHYIRRYGEEAFAEKMSWYELMTIRRRH